MCHMKEIKLTNCDKYTKVSDEDFEKLSKQEWRLCNGGVVTGTIRAGGEVPSQMHRIILGMPMHIGTVDHIDRDKLNNQRSNLRVCSQSENLYNSKKQTKTSSEYKGVSWCTRDKTWVAYISLKKKSIRLLTSKIEIECAYAYNCAAKFFELQYYYHNQVDNQISDERKKKINDDIVFWLKLNYPDFKQIIKSGY